MKLGLRKFCLLLTYRSSGLFKGCGRSKFSVFNFCLWSLRTLLTMLLASFPMMFLLPEDSCSKLIPIRGAKHDLEIGIPSYKNPFNCIFSKQR